MSKKYSGELTYGIIIGSIFLLSRYVFYLKGGEFIARPLLFAKQYLDPQLLQNDLLTSLMYLHAQPPLFNFFLGSVLKLSPMPELSYELLFRTAGLLMPLIFYRTLITIGLQCLLAFAIIIVFMFNPTLILYENLLYYTYIEAFFILLSIFYLLRWATEKKWFSLVMFWVSLLCLGMIRSLFHPVFFLMITAILFLYVWRVLNVHTAKRFLIYSCIALIPIFAWGIKNKAVYGFFGTSSWTGISLWIKTNGYSTEKLEELQADGLISLTAVKAELEPFRPIKELLSEKVVNALRCHHPADCNEWRSSGYPNFNHVGYVVISKQLLKDARALIEYDLSLFAIYTAGSYSLTQWYSSDSVHALFENNMKIVWQIEKVYRFLYFGFLGVESKISDPKIWIRTAVISIVMIFFYAATIARVFKNKDRRMAELTLVCLFCCLIHAYTLAVSSFIEFGENNRFRFPVDAAFLILMAGNIVMWIQRKISQTAQNSEDNKTLDIA